MLFGTIALYLGIAALRQVAALYSESNPAFVDVDLALYYVVIVPAAFVIVPHVYLVTNAWSGNQRRSFAAATVFLAVVAVGLVFAYVGGVDGPVRSEFGTDWSLRSRVTQVLLVVAIMVPGIAGSATLVTLSRRLGKDDRRRIRLIGWSCLAYFVVFTLDAFGLAGIALLAARLATAGTGLLARAAYRSKSIEHAPAPFKPGEGPFES